MGYEVKIYVGEKFDGMKELGADYFSVAGMMDLCKPGYRSELYKLCAETSADKKYPAIRAYLRNGNECEFADCYEKPLRAIPLELVLDALVQDAKNDRYHRFNVAVDFLKAFKEGFKSDRLAAVLYGY